MTAYNLTQLHHMGSLGQMDVKPPPAHEGHTRTRTEVRSQTFWTVERWIRADQAADCKLAPFTIRAQSPPYV